MSETTIAARRPLFRVRKKFGGHSGKPGAQPNNGHAMKSGVWAVLTTRNLDGRCQLARALRAIEVSLYDALGGRVSPQKQIIIGRAAFKLYRCAQIEADMLAGVEGMEPLYLSVSSALRKDLEAVGLEALEPPAPTLAQYLEARQASEPGQPEAPSE